jgi:oxygen-independent coproporphyrinogen-3 oxidase
MDRLDRQGYRQYEISNVARRGRASRHNLKYWTDGEWVGFGCGAHSTVGGTRWKNVSATEEYVRRVAAGTGVVTERHELTEEERLGDALFTGLRLSDGIDIAEIGERYTTDVWARYGEALQPYIDARWLERRGNRLLLTRAGMLMANEVMTAFV